MCGRFRLARKKEILEAEFGDGVALDHATDELAPPYVPRYNIAPGQDVVAVRQDAERRMTLLRWGLIPSWANLAGFKMINARAETAAAKPSFRELLHSRRCLIPADGFYEWKRDGKEKLPFCFTLADESVFALAGLWERSQSPQGIVESCTILTTQPNELMRGVHDRMPVILPRDAYGMWLDPGFTRIPELEVVLKAYPAEAMRRYRVSQRVNDVKNEDAACAAEIEAA
jgi:putative SOS response-associated peptidase YedK